MDFTTWLNASGISLEIIGFILLLIAVKQMPKPSKEKGQKVGSFSSDWDYLGNVMSTRHDADRYDSYNPTLANQVRILNNLKFRITKSIINRFNSPRIYMELNLEIIN